MMLNPLTATVLMTAFSLTTAGLPEIGRRVDVAPVTRTGPGNPDTSRAAGTMVVPAAEPRDGTPAMRLAQRAPLRTAIRSLDVRLEPDARPLAVGAVDAARVARQRKSKVGRMIAFGAIGGFGGLYAGAYLGGTIENWVSPCHCDDPGLVGTLIGAPIGAAVGAVVGVLLARR